MLPVRLVLDTNIIVSAAINEDGLERTTLSIALAKPARLYYSSEVFAEYAEVLQRPYLGISKGLRLQALQLIKRRGHLISPKRRLAVCGDPCDDQFIECADAARADYLITGNRKHFPAFWKGTKIISTREFIDLVAPHLLD